MATSFPSPFDSGRAFDEDPSGCMVAAEVSILDFDPNDRLSFVGLRGWSQAKEMDRTLLRFAPAYLTSFVPLGEPSVAPMSLSSAIGGKALQGERKDGDNTAGPVIVSLANLPARGDLKDLY